MWAEYLIVVVLLVCAVFVVTKWILVDAETDELELDLLAIRNKDVSTDYAYQVNVASLRDEYTCYKELMKDSKNIMSYDDWLIQRIVIEQGE